MSTSPAQSQNWKQPLLDQYSMVPAVALKPISTSVTATTTFCDFKGNVIAVYLQDIMPIASHKLYDY